jgi:hypothetical protein
MKQLEENALYRQLMRPGATEETLQKSLSKYGKSADVDTEVFNKVVERLSPTVKVKVEGAAIKNALNRWTDGINTEAQAINFPALSAELNGLNLQTKTAKGIRKVVQEFANIYKNDKNLADIATQFNARKPANSISTSYVQKGMFAIVGQTWEAFYRYLPTRGAHNLALVHYLAKVLDNPLNVKTVDEFVKQLPVEKQAEMRSLVKDLQVQMAKQGPQAPKATVNMYKQTKTGSLAVTNGTMGKGIYLVDKVKAPNPDSKIVKQVVTVSEMATLDDISTLVGKNVTLKDIRTIPNLQKQLEDKGFKGIKVEDKAMLFPEKTTSNSFASVIANKTSTPTLVEHAKLYHGSSEQRFASSMKGPEGVSYFSPNKKLITEVYTDEGGVVSEFSSSAKLIDALKDKEFISYIRKVTGLKGTDEEVISESLTGASAALIDSKFAPLISYLKKVGADGVQVGGEIIIPNNNVSKVLKDAK